MISSKVIIYLTLPISAMLNNVSTPFVSANIEEKPEWLIQYEIDDLSNVSKVIVYFFFNFKFYLI